MSTTKPDTFVWTIVTALFIGMGLTFILFSLIYAQDVAEVLSTPERLWNAICGLPMAVNELNMPILRALGAAAITLGIALQWIKNRMLSLRLIS